MRVRGGAGASQKERRRANRCCELSIEQNLPYACVLYQTHNRITTPSVKLLNHRLNRCMWARWLCAPLPRLSAPLRVKKHPKKNTTPPTPTPHTPPTALPAPLAHTAPPRSPAKKILRVYKLWEFLRGENYMRRLNPYGSKGNMPRKENVRTIPYFPDDAQAA